MKTFDELVEGIKELKEKGFIKTHRTGDTGIGKALEDLLGIDENNFAGPVNIGNPVEFSIKELAEKVIDLTNSPSKIIYTSARIDDPVRRKPDITLAKEKLGWEPIIKLEEGLKKTINYFDKILSSS